MRIMIFIILVFGLLVGCGAEQIEPAPVDPCAGFSCGESGTCIVVEEQAQCNCNEGYHVFRDTCIVSQICERDFSLQTDADLVELAHCTEVIGNIDINESSIPSLEGLENLKVIHGDFEIGGLGFVELTNLKGLDGLERIKGNLDFHSNANLDNILNLQNLKEVKGNLIIGMGTIRSLEGLNKLTQVGGDLMVLFCAQLPTLQGLNNLISVGEDLSVHLCDGLESVNGLDSLETIGGYFLFDGNPKVQDFRGMENLKTIGGDLYIGRWDGNNSLESLEGLEGLVQIAGGLWLQHNWVLTDLSALSDLQVVGKDLVVENNASLTQLNGLELIESVGDDLVMIDNASLVDISGVLNIRWVEKRFLVWDNPLLPQCTVDAFIDLIGEENIQGEITTYGNSDTNSCDE